MRSLVLYNHRVNEYTCTWLLSNTTVQTVNSEKHKLQVENQRNLTLDTMVYMSSLVLYNPRVNKYNCTRLLSDTNVQTVNCVFLAQTCQWCTVH
jgi:hypothetical protein